MNLRATAVEWGRISAPFLGAILLVGAVILICWLLPNRTAALLLGALAAAALCYALRDGPRAPQVALMWLAIGVSADAAYAKLNDQPSFTIANGLMRLFDGLVKLVDTLLKGIGIGTADARVKLGAVTPDFVWALILSLILFLWLSFLLRRER